jgi:hypothetical protein
LHAGASQWIEHTGVELDGAVASIILTQKELDDFAVRIDIEAVREHEAIADVQVELPVDRTRIAQNDPPDRRVAEDIEAIAVKPIAVIALLRPFDDRVAAATLAERAIGVARATRFAVGATTDELTGAVAAGFATNSRRTVGEGEIALLAWIDDAVAADRCRGHGEGAETNQ